MAEITGSPERATGVTGFARIVSLINNRASWISCVAAGAMMVFVCCDVILRYFRHPITGSNDITQLLSAVLVTFGIGYTQVLKRHTSVSIITSNLSPRAKRILAGVTTLVSLAFFIVVIWQSCAFAGRMQLNEQGTGTLGIPTAPFVYGVALGFALLCLVLMVELLALLRKEKK
jgi:C4-dicarboxylate transporter, DctQ subunit